MKKIQKLQYCSCREKWHAWNILEWCNEHERWEPIGDSSDLYNAKTRLIPNMISYREKYQNNLPSAWIKISRITSLSDFHWQYSGSLLASRCQGGITDAQSVLIYYNVQEQLKDNTINWEQEPIVLKQQSIKIMRKAERAIGL